jgi:hypothetical protein
MRSNVFKNKPKIFRISSQDFDQTPNFSVKKCIFFCNKTEKSSLSKNCTHFLQNKNILPKNQMQSIFFWGEKCFQFLKVPRNKEIFAGKIR